MDKVAVGAVVTAFHPDGILDQLIEELARQVAYIVVVDNTPVGERTVENRHPTHRLEYIRTGKNLGLAAALNCGVQHLERFCLSHVSFWDQDSVPPPGYVREALVRSRSLAEWPNVIVCGDHVGPADLVTPGVDRSEQKVIRLITSGMLVPVPALRSVGPFREDFFVDAVDMDFSLRARAHGVSLYTIRDLAIRHRLGDPARSRKPFLFRSETSGHPVWRHYWIVRNQTILLDEYRRLDVEAVSVIKKTQRRWFLRHLMAGPDRLRLVSAIVIGRRDARNGRVREFYDPRTGGGRGIRR
ncbi:MAG: glycosyltransferase [Pseudonocardiaceae bacterium]